jgi:hypothetical protein
MSDEIIEQIKQNTEDLKSVINDVSQEKADSEESLEVDVQNKKVKTKKTNEPLSEVLKECKDSKTQQHAVWADVIKFIASFFKYSFVTWSVTSMLTTIIGPQGLGVILQLLSTII